MSSQLCNGRTGVSVLSPPACDGKECLGGNLPQPPAAVFPPRLRTQGCLYALLAAGASPACVCCLGNSALHVAACNGSLQAIRCLATAGVPLAARNRLGQTPRQVTRGAALQGMLAPPAAALSPPTRCSCLLCNPLEAPAWQAEIIFLF